jgi:hypothetical protein
MDPLDTLQAELDQDNREAARQLGWEWPESVEPEPDAEA